MAAWFDALAIASFILAIIAILRARGGSLILAANNGLAARALANVARYGQPDSQSFVPQTVFASETIEISRNVLIISTLCILVFVLVGRDRKRPEIVPRKLPFYRLIYGFAGVYLLVFIFSSKTIAQYDYTDPDRVYALTSLGGAHALIIGLVLYELYRRVVIKDIKPLRAFAALFVLCIMTDFAKGATGMATGILVCGAVLFVGYRRAPSNRILVTLTCVVSIACLSALIRGIRGTLAHEGVASVRTFVNSLTNPDESEERTGEGVEKLGNSTQTAVHILECITLYEAGMSREWRSIYNPVIYTFEPAFLLGPLGITRPQEAAWELSDHFIHGGGINVLGEFYWNGGYLCVIVMCIALNLLTFVVDSRFRASWRWLMIFCAFEPGLLQGFGYGVAQISRGLFNGLLALAGVALWEAFRRTRRPPKAALATSIRGPAAQQLPTVTVPRP